MIGASLRCPICGSAAFDDVLSIPKIPVLINAQLRPEEAAGVARGDMDLVVCRSCAHMYNRSFDPALLDYDAAYENSLHFSATFQRFARALADRLVVDHALAGSRVAELGSGPGHFLSMLCDAGVAEALGYDPSYDPDRLGAPNHPAVSVSTERFPDDGSVPVRLAFSQHVLEHLDDPVHALADQRSAVLAAEGVVYTEVPNGALMVERCALWDLVYEHRSYFVPTSLDLACRRAGLRPTAMGTAFGDQFLWCEARPESDGIDQDGRDSNVRASVDAALAFGLAAIERIGEARRDLESWAASGPVALWGAGSKGMTFLNVVADVDHVAAVVDINPRKAGFGVPGTSLSISGPNVLAEIRPRTVLVANPAYVEEVSTELRGLDVDAEVRPLWS